MEYRLCREKEVEGTAALKDLSREGMRFSVGTKLDRGTLLDIKVILNQDTAPVFLTGEVVWISKSQEKTSFGYLVGAKFYKIEKLDKSRILDYAYNNWLATQRSTNSNN